MLQILAVTLPFFAIVGCGWLVARNGVLPMEAIPGMNGFVLFFALPCMLFRFASGTPIARLLDASVFGVYVLCALAMVAFAVATTRRRGTGWNDAAFGALVAAFPNSGFLGVPLLVALLGARAAGPAIVALAIDMVLTSSLCIALSRLDGAAAQGAGQAAARALKGMVRNPLPWAIALGYASSATQLVPPPPLMRGVAMLADAASPVALFTIGMMLARPRPRLAPSGTPGHRAGTGDDVVRVVLYKLALHPLLVLAVGHAAMALGLPLEPFSLTVLVLSAALPSASNVPILAERFGADAGRVARIVMLSTVVAFVSFPVAVALVR
ncbi:AEC family transporter [Azohydromonas aeria]|uniref:AEC family transporter n=1 Tax=Azohydromonas aeria TaxID=2590212 RepID=UPI0012FC050A|nr:AEC family transporter [Azohydromonas aeria]